MEGKYLTQTDPRWANEKFPYGNKTIGQIGCLVTSITNILREQGKHLTPDEVLNLLANNNGLTTGNLVVWSVVDKIFNLSHTKLSVKNAHISIDDNYNYVIEIDCKTFYHFCNVMTIDHNSSVVTYFDVYDDKLKNINFDKVVSIRRLG